MTIQIQYVLFESCLELANNTPVALNYMPSPNPVKMSVSAPSTSTQNAIPIMTRPSMLTPFSQATTVTINQAALVGPSVFNPMTR
jgi:hypothetical protein